jgi:hypothetical protein
MWQRKKSINSRYMSHSLTIAIMSQRINAHADFLKMLTKAAPPERRNILKNADDEKIKCICEVALNTLKQRVALTEDQYRALRKHKQTLRFLSDRRVSLPKKKKKVSQAGGFLLPLLIPVLTTILASVLQ